jgi:hypothetical protein
MRELKPIETWYDGHRFRSRTEARWAVFFKAAGIRYEYEKEGYALPSGCYLPDFFLPDLRFWFEVKGAEPTPLEIALILELRMATGNKGLLAVGSPSPEDQIIYPGRWTPDDGPDAITSERFYFCDDRKNDGEFWLVSDESGAASSIGPSCGRDHGKYPCVHSATAKGYAAARSARFEHFGK